MSLDPLTPDLRQSLWRVTATLALATLAALLCVYIRTPLPWMIGPMLATAGASMLGLPTEGLISLRN